MAACFAPGNVPNIRDLECVFGNVVGAVLSLAAVALFLMLLYGGYKYLTSGGEAKGIEESQKTLTYAIGGLFLIVLSFLIIKFIEIFTGAQITTFRIFIP